VSFRSLFLFPSRNFTVLVPSQFSHRVVSREKAVKQAVRDELVEPSAAKGGGDQKWSEK